MSSSNRQKNTDIVKCASKVIPEYKKRKQILKDEMPQVAKKRSKGTLCTGSFSSSEVPCTPPIIVDTVSSFEFSSCLNSTAWDITTPENALDSKLGVGFLLKRCLSIRELEDESWLSSSLIDLVISTFSRRYENIFFLPIEFIVLALTATKEEMINVTDINGHNIDFNSKRPIVFICNSQNIHWNMIRILFHPEPELQLFEPMGKPTARRIGLNFRSVPRGVINWLDVCYPLKLKASWQSVAISAITKMQQFNSYDCGVACLLYAEKCGQGQTKEQIDACTNQEDITEYRKVIKTFVDNVWT